MKEQCKKGLQEKSPSIKNKTKSNIKTYCANCNRLFQKLLKAKKKSLLDITVDADVPATLILLPPTVIA